MITVSEFEVLKDTTKAEVYCKTDTCRFRKDLGVYNKCNQPAVTECFSKEYPGKRVYIDTCGNCGQCGQCVIGAEKCEYRDYIVDKRSIFEQ